MQSADDAASQSTQEIFHRAAELREDEQSRYLTAVCGDDPARRQRVERMLAADSTPHADWQFPAMEAFARRGGAEPPVDYTARSFGPYRVLERIGAGGMGVVYKAVREDNEYRQTVAIKILPGGLDTEERITRFRHERQILANLAHPNIARLLDGGTTDDGLPYLVLDFIEGLPLDRFVQKTVWPPAQKLRLFQRIADAVTFAHRNLVVHCDLKPANILVESDGTPKLLDFGISQLLDEGRLSRTATAPLMTPEYASPEQVMAKPISTATDVYALGVLLYVLMTGRRPYDTETGAGNAAQVSRAVCERALDTSELPEDLGTIVSMATRKEPTRRYTSVEQLSADIGNYLACRPVLARPDTVGYRAGKFMRRHRVSIAAAVLVSVSLLAGVLLSLSEASDARAARSVAEKERARAEQRSGQADAAQVSAEQQRQLARQQADLARNEQGRSEQRLTDILQLANKSLFDVHAAIQSLPGATEARREIVNTTLQYLESLSRESGDDPRLRLALGSAYLRVSQVQSAPYAPSLGDTPGAIRSLKIAEGWIAPLRGKQPPDPKVLDAWLDIRTAQAQIISVAGQERAAGAMLKALLPDARLLTHISPEDPREWQLDEALSGASINFDTASGVEYAQMAIAGFHRYLERHQDDKDAQESLASAESNWAGNVRSEDMAVALVHFRESARIRENMIAKYPDSVSARRGLMLVYGHIAGAMGDSFQLTSLNDIEGARLYYGKAAAIARELMKADPVNRLAQWDMASVSVRLGALDPKPGAEAESLAWLESARDLFENIIRMDPADSNYQFSLALTYQYIGIRHEAAGRFPEALDAYRSEVDLADRLLLVNPGQATAFVRALNGEQLIAKLMAKTGDRAMAIEYANRAVNRTERPSPDPALWTSLRQARAYEVLAIVRQHFEEWPEARAAAVRSANEWRTVAAGMTDSHEADIDRIDKMVADCERHLP